MWEKLTELQAHMPIESEIRVETGIFLIKWNEWMHSSHVKIELKQMKANQVDDSSKARKMILLVVRPDLFAFALFILERENWRWKVNKSQTKLGTLKFEGPSHNNFGGVEGERSIVSLNV